MPLFSAFEDVYLEIEDAFVHGYAVVRAHRANGLDGGVFVAEAFG